MSTAKLNPIKKARLKQGMTQQAVADLIGVSKGAVSRWENGLDEPSARKAMAICKILRGLKFEDIYPNHQDEQGRAAA